MTPEQQAVVTALEQPAKIRADGKAICQVCGEPYAKAGLGPHQVKHRIEIGLIERKVVKLPKGITVPCPECNGRYNRHGLPNHLRVVHEMTHDQSIAASQKARIDLAESLNGQQPEPSREIALRVNGHEPKQEPLMFREVSAVDAATDLLLRARSDGQVPIKLLPNIFEWVVETGKLLHRLERMSR